MDVSVTESLGFRAHFSLVIFAGVHQAELGFFILMPENGFRNLVFSWMMHQKVIAYQAHTEMSFSCMLHLSSQQLLDSDLPTLPFCLSIST